MKKVMRLTETDLKRIVNKVLSESDGENSKPKKDKKPRCIPENVIPLDEMRLLVELKSTEVILLV